MARRAKKTKQKIAKKPERISHATTDAALPARILATIKRIPRGRVCT